MFNLVQINNKKIICLNTKIRLKLNFAFHKNEKKKELTMTKFEFRVDFFLLLSNHTLINSTQNIPY